MLKLNYDAAHRFVDSYPPARWDGWDILIFKPTPAGASHSRGAFVNGQWGIQTRVSPDAEGNWKLRV